MTRPRSINPFSRPILSIKPVKRPVDAVVKVPGSKSITNRALVLAGMSDGPARIIGALFSEDTQYMFAALRRLGLFVDQDGKSSKYLVYGESGQMGAGSRNLDVGNSGTAARFLTAFCSLGHGTYLIDGVERMRQRPI